MAAKSKATPAADRAANADGVSGANSPATLTELLATGPAHPAPAAPFLVAANVLGALLNVHWRTICRWASGDNTDNGKENLPIDLAAICAKLNWPFDVIRDCLLQKDKLITSIPLVAQAHGTSERGLQLLQARGLACPACLAFDWGNRVYWSSNQLTKFMQGRTGIRIPKPGDDQGLTV